MSWNHRVIDTIEEFKKRDPTYMSGLEHLYSIHEVFYDENMNPEGWTENGIRLGEFEEIKEIEWTLKKCLEALKKPILKIVYDENGGEKLEEVK